MPGSGERPPLPYKNKKNGGYEASVLSVAAGLKMAEVAMLMPPISNGICQPLSSHVDHHHDDHHLGDDDGHDDDGHDDDNGNHYAVMKMTLALMMYR